jgi:hypothetical protein
MFESIYKKRKNPLFNIAGWGLLGLICLIFMFVGYSPNVSFMGSASAVAMRTSAVTLNVCRKTVETRSFLPLSAPNCKKK